MPSSTVTPASTPQLQPRPIPELTVPALVRLLARGGVTIRETDDLDAARLYVKLDQGGVIRYIGLADSRGRHTDWTRMARTARTRRSERASKAALDLFITERAWTHVPLEVVDVDPIVMRAALAEWTGVDQAMALASSALTPRDIEAIIIRIAMMTGTAIANAAHASIFYRPTAHQQVAEVLVDLEYRAHLPAPGSAPVVETPEEPLCA